ncbi:putative nicotianamine synthase [Lachnellula occidentalis]|uniref:Putative nicotianamine synthase n=1 Tax=Lachnellula occidentalis TaxID=215460 RepID=A0A8H8RQD6_9HELO|nr:putative nicotianamine synthase [Lachnellula occidentalis]
MGFEATDADAQSASDTLADDIISPEAQSYVKQILSLYYNLSKQPDLRPCTYTNALFTELILENAKLKEILPGLRALCAEAECCLESRWADTISRGANTQEGKNSPYHSPTPSCASSRILTIPVNKLLVSFPYYSNYIDLTRLELAALQTVDPTPPRQIAFIGSGPLPLTSLCLLSSLNEKSPRTLIQSLVSYLPSWLNLTAPEQPEVAVLNIDHNESALIQSEWLCMKLGKIAKQMSFSLSSASSPPPLHTFPVVYLAALVGASQPQKETLVQSVVAQMKEGALLVIRTSWGLRSLLYPAFDCTTEGILSALEICVVVHPYGHVVNSVIVGRVRARARTLAKSATAA